MATSYSNDGGSGDRRSFITVTSTAIAGFGRYWIDGSRTDTNSWLPTAAVAGKYIEFAFPDKVIIDEATLYQSSATSHGVWQWQGSHDESVWTDIGATFTLGVTATQVQTTLSGNTTGYKFYRLLGISGSANGTPYLHEFEFKISDDPADAYSYLRGGCTDRRLPKMLSTSSGVPFSRGDVSLLVDGATLTTDCFWSGGSSAGGYLQFDFGSGITRVINEIRWIQNVVASHGTWKFQGSNDGSAFTDLGSSFTLGSAIIQTISIGSNTTSYRFYRLTSVSGITNSNPFLYEIQFRLDQAPALVSGILVSKANAYTVLQPPTGIDVSKANLYSVIQPPTGIAASKANLYAVLSPPAGINVSKTNIYAVLDPSSKFQIDGTSTVSWEGQIGLSSGFVINGTSTVNWEADVSAAPDLKFQIDGTSTISWEPSVGGPSSANFTINGTSTASWTADTVHIIAGVRVTQTVLEHLRDVPSETRTTQNALEHAKYDGLNYTRTTQNLLEAVKYTPNLTRTTQNALEIGRYPVQDIYTTQNVLEVAHRLVVVVPPEEEGFGLGNRMLYHFGFYLIGAKEFDTELESR